MRKNEAITILETIATIPSISGSERILGETLAGLLQQIGCHVQTIEIDDGGFDVLGFVGIPNILFASHMDTVPGGKPFGKTADTFVGRGVCDAKASIAAMIAAAHEAIQKRQTNFGLAFTVGEETTFRGAIRLIEKIKPFPFTIVGEPTSLTVVNGQFGCRVFSVKTKGRSAHSSRPEEGINAIDLMIDGILRTKKMPLMGHTFFSVCRIDGGVADNIIPDRAQALLSFRTDPSDTTDYGMMIQKSMGGNTTVEEVLSLPGIFTDIPTELDFLKHTARTVTYGSELSLYKHGVILGPGDIRVAHSDTETIRLDDVVAATEIYGKIIRNFQIRN